MRAGAIPEAAFRAGVVAVPPLAWKAEAELDRNENVKIVRHLEAGGVRLLMYAGNANFYHLCGAPHEGAVAMLAEVTGPDTWVIPAVGPAFSDLDRAGRHLRSVGFPAAMLLPADTAAPSGVPRAMARFARAFGGPVLLYIRRPGYVEPRAAAEMAARGDLWLLKYGHIAPDPASDSYLTALVDALGPERILSGSGEIVAAQQLPSYRLLGFTSGAACLAPSLSMALRAALSTPAAGDAAAPFRAFEAARDATHPIAALHEGVALAGIASTGPILPPLGPLDKAARERVDEVARALLATELRHRAANTEGSTTAP